jgi:hypothetical protein
VRVIIFRVAWRLGLIFGLRGSGGAAGKGASHTFSCPRICGSARSSSSTRLPEAAWFTYQTPSSVSLSRRLFGRISVQFCSM